MPIKNPDGTLTYSAEEVAAMPVAEANALIRKAVKIEGTAVVKDKDTGKIRYDRPELAGSYGEDKLES